MRAEISLRGTHQDGSQSACGVAAEVSKARFNGRGGSTGSGFNQADRCGARNRDHIGESSARPRARISDVSAQPGREPDHAMAQGNQFESIAPGISAFAKEILGPALLGSRVSRGQLGQYH